MSATHLFQNEHAYAIAIALSRVDDGPLPFVEIEMAGPSDQFVPVVGKMDTGSFMTMLDFPTTKLLGIVDPESGPEWRTTVANGQPMMYYVHTVFVRVKIDPHRFLRFQLAVGACQSLASNLFGIDWTEHMIVVVDRERVHLLRD